MGRRTYGAPGSKTSVCDTRVYDSGKIAKRYKVPLIFRVIVMIFILLIAMVVLFFAFRNFLDFGKGAIMPDIAVTEYVNAIADRNNDNLKKYIPPKIRKFGFTSNSNNISELQALDEKYDISFLNANAVLSDDDLNTDELERILFNAYGVNINIRNAKGYMVESHIRCVIDEKKFDIPVEMHMIAIKVGFKWYVCTIDATGESDLISDGLNKINGHIDSDNIVSDDIVDNSNDEKDIVIRDAKPIIFYEKARTDLENGYVIIDDIEYKMPAKYSDMVDLFLLNDMAIGADRREITPNYILKNLPFVLTNDNYSNINMHVSIGNNTEDVIDVADGIISTLYIGLPDDFSEYDYPYLYLPGNITFLSSYDDVVKMYGRLSEFDNKNDNVYLYSDDVNVYEFNLYGNERNHIYFEFQNDKLVAIQWYVHDFGNIQ